MGYAGAAMRDLSNAAGLTKAALYHRFPEGKDAMAAAALDWVCREMEVTVLATLDADAPLPVRLSNMMAALDHYYADGANACLIELFSQQSAPPSLRDAVRLSAEQWLTAVAAAVRIGNPKPGKTVFVSAAAGAVGC